VRDELWSLAVTMTIVGAGAMGLSLLCAWLVAGRALEPVQRINETARRMAAGELSARIAVDRTETELGQVALALNLAFDRLHDAAERQRRFTADASHELRTPVTMLSAEVDWALMRDRSREDYRDALETCSRVAARMRGLVQGLLTLARDALVARAVGSMRQLAAERHVTVAHAVAPAAVLGDGERLLQLLHHLLFNAIVYSAPHGHVRVEGGADGATVTVRVVDDGIGIPAEELPRVFDRFYRGAHARTREPAGAGLGLAVARTIAEAHGGTIACTSEAGRGSEFAVRLNAVNPEIEDSLTGD
jgi:signal transduction histidine kinase